MKFLMKLFFLPLVILIDFITWVCVGLISCTSIVFRLASSMVALLGAAVLVTYSVENGLILLTIAFLISPIGLPMLAVKLLGGLQMAASALRNL